jgi:hypothetical protein
MPRTDPTPIPDESMDLAHSGEAVLVLHPTSPRLGVDAIHVTVGMEARGLLALTYALSGNLEGLRIPAVGPVTPGDRLWEHTCFEAFIRAEGAPGYLEFNFSPARRWAGYSFKGYRDPDAPWSGVVPSIEARASADRLELSVRLPAAVGSLLHRAGSFRLALSTVIESSDGQMAYWALRHAEGRPDFHHADAFTLAVNAPVSGVPT